MCSIAGVSPVHSLSRRKPSGRPHVASWSSTTWVAGWVNTRKFLETGDAAAAQGWSPFVLDTNGNGKRDDFVEPGAASDAAKDTRVNPGSGP